MKPHKISRNYLYRENLPAIGTVLRYNRHNYVVISHHFDGIDPARNFRTGRSFYALLERIEHD